MKKEDYNRQKLENDDMLPEYDFKGGIRGKHYKEYRQGHIVTIHKTDGTTVVQHFKLEERAIFLDPEILEYFPDSESVNKTLRSLIGLIPQKRHRNLR
jgi:hypothetical protein